MTETDNQINHCCEVRGTAVRESAGGADAVDVAALDCRC